MFEGEPDSLVVETRIQEMEKMFYILQYPKDMKVKLAIPILKENAKFWLIAINAT